MPANTAAAEKPHVLVVDDSRVVRHTIFRILGNDFQVTQAEDGALGWQSAQQAKADIVISDINMPQLDGYGFICKIRGADNPKVRDIPIIVITSAEDDETRARAYACGASDFILKPFNANQLLDCIQTQLSHHDERVQELEARFGSAIETIEVSDVLPE